MLRKVNTVIVTLFLLASACGKNDGLRPLSPGQPYPPGGPIVQAPPPPNGGNFPPPPGYHPGMNPPPGYFNPRIPPGFGNQFYPFAPIYNFYQQNVILQPVFINIWQGWQDYCYQNYIDIYDFTTFWYEYSPQVMSPQTYNYLDSSFYWWMDPWHSFDPYVSGNSFWQNYNWMPYSCMSGCY